MDSKGGVFTHFGLLGLQVTAFDYFQAADGDNVTAME